MTELNPNPNQQQIINSTEGIYKVDAGAGTGKTFAITRRYASIVDQQTVDPDDVLLVTFTNNAATEMKERIVDDASYSMRTLADAPIQTFHSLCQDLLDEHGHAAPTLLGLDGYITSSTQVIDNDLVEESLFEDYFDRFSASHPEHDSLLKLIDEPTDLLSLIKQLTAKGVFPTAEGWYRDGEAHLDGDLDAFEDLFATQNAPRNGGSKQSTIREGLNDYGSDSLYPPTAPSKSSVRGSGKQIPQDIAKQAFESDRSELKSFIHDLYFEYMAFALDRNYVNFGFLQLFAYVMLCENDHLRESIAFEYVMVDEFQDTSEIQFKLALLLAGTSNFCVVGDWKQSIYGFQYAAVENLTAFEDRLRQFRGQLNDTHRRVTLSDTAIGDLQEIELTTNYRSSQSILDFSTHAFDIPAVSSEDLNSTDIESLDADRSTDRSRIEAFYHPDEQDAILTKIETIVGNPAYEIDTSDGYRSPTYDDIAVFTRNRAFGRELLEAAERESIPMAYDGGVELFRTSPAKLLLAWLRILEYDADRGWAPVLEQAGYTLDEIDHILETRGIPEPLEQFQAAIASLSSVGAVARRVFNRYGYRGAYADVLLNTIQSMYDATTLTRGDMINLIERGIENGSTHDVTTSTGADSVTVQTIHAAKGLEYPIVILANMNQGAFPPRGGSTHTICYNDPIGLRQRTEYGTHHGHPYCYDNWQMDILSTCLPRAYDEERRLLYVAMTRAESHLLFASGKKSNTFLDELPLESSPTEPDLGSVESTTTTQSNHQFTISEPDGPNVYTPHSLMDTSVMEAAPHGRGREFGDQLHSFAEEYALTNDVSPRNSDEQAVKEFLDTCEGELLIEQEVYLPLTIGDERVVISGIADLVHIRPDMVTVVDYKTVVERSRQAEYRKQLSVYWHVVNEIYPNRTVTASIFYTNDASLEEISPLSKADLAQLVSTAQNDSKE